MKVTIANFSELGNDWHPGAHIKVQMSFGDLQELQSLGEKRAKYLRIIDNWNKQEQKILEKYFKSGGTLCQCSAVVKIRCGADYSQMTNDEFYDILEEVSGCNLSIPGVYESCAEACNNDVLDTWAERNPEKAYPEESDAK